MAKVPRWLKITGIGLGAVIIMVVVLVVGSTLYVKSTLQAFESADGSIDAVDAQYGAVEAFSPDPSGAIAPGRVEAFLAAREGVAPTCREVEKTLAVLCEGEASTGKADAPGERPAAGDGKVSGKQDASAYSVVKAGLGLPGQLAGYGNRRSDALLNGQMSHGEYYYVYTLAYFSWLGKSPADGPPFKLVGDHGYFMENIFEGLDESTVRDYRMEQTRRSLNRILLPVLRNQLAGLSPERVDGTLQPWRETLKEEIAALEADGLRLPWEGNLPEAIATSLEPYRDRLESSYSPMCNEVELAVARR
jgi:hypothetical protein